MNEHLDLGLPRLPEVKQQAMNIVVSRELFENLVDDAISLRAEWLWKVDEERCGFSKEYSELKERIAQAVKIRDLYRQ